MLVYRFPKGTGVNGPQQIMAQMKNQQEISYFMTVNNQQGSRVIFGNLLAIPIESTLLYVVPAYVQANATGPAAIPQLRQVIVASGDRIAMRETLDAALTALTAGTAHRAPRPPHRHVRPPGAPRCPICSAGRTTPIAGHASGRRSTIGLWTTWARPCGSFRPRPDTENSSMERIATA